MAAIPVTGPQEPIIETIPSIMAIMDLLLAPPGLAGAGWEGGTLAGVVFSITDPQFTQKDAESAFCAPQFLQ
jgi:hypothetical protein